MSNIVPFPRDWLGPRDELVPFGRDALDKPEARAGAEDVHALAPPPGPEAFWGEDSAEIHAVLPGPDAGSRDPEPESRPNLKTRHRPSRAFVGIVAGLLTVVAAAAITIIGFGSKSSQRAEIIPNPVQGSPHAEEVRLASLQRSLAASAASDTHKQRRMRKHVATNRSPHRPSHRSAPKPAQHVVVAQSSSPTYPVTTQPVSSPASTASAAQSSPPLSSAQSQPVDVPSSSSTGRVVSQPSQPTGSSTASSGGATSSHSEGQSSNAKAPAGPTGKSALLGPGHCNC